MLHNPVDGFLHDRLAAVFGTADAAHVESSIRLARSDVENENNGRNTALLDSSGIIRERS